MSRKWRSFIHSPHEKMPIIIRKHCVVHVMILSGSNFEKIKQWIPWMRKLTMNQSKLCCIERTKSNKGPIIHKPTNLMRKE